VRNYRYPNAIPPLGTPMVDAKGQPSDAWRRYFEAITTQLGGQGGDMLTDLRTLSESSNARDIEELRALIDQLSGQISDTASQLEQAKQDAERQAAVLTQDVSTIVALRPLGPLAEKSTVDTPDITQNAVTNADSTTATGSRTGASFTEIELVRHTQVLTSGSTAILQGALNGTDILSGQAYTLSVASGFRDIVLRFIRDPDGTPVELFTSNLKVNQGAGPSAYALSGYNFIYEDSGHSGGSVTWAIVLTSYTAGTTTINGCTLAHNDITRSIYCLEAKR
jgi:hypothetical protein